MPRRKKERKPSVKEIRAACDHPHWEKMRSGRERCTSCGMVFPCRKACLHLDCGEEVGDIDFVADELGVGVYDSKTGECIYDPYQEG